MFLRVIFWWIDVFFYCNSMGFFFRMNRINKRIVLLSSQRVCHFWVFDKFFNDFGEILMSEFESSSFISHNRPHKIPIFLSNEPSAKPRKYRVWFIIQMLFILPLSFLFMSILTRNEQPKKIFILYTQFFAFLLSISKW